MISLPFLIGRGPQCHLRPANPIVAERHCAVLARDGKVFVRDFGSEAGICINGQRIEGECRLWDSDELTVGTLTFAVSLRGAATQKLTQSGSYGTDDDSVADMLLYMESATTTTGLELGAETTEAILASTHVNKPVEENADTHSGRLPPLGKPRPEGYSPSRDLMKKLLGGRR